MTNITNDGRKGGLLYGPTDKGNGKGITAEVIGGNKVILGGGESIINEEATKIHCEELSRINQSTGGRPIECSLQKEANTGKMEDGGVVTTEEVKQSREDFFELPKATSLNELESNINNILSQYAHRKMANLQVLDYVTEKKELGKEWLKEKGIFDKEGFDKYLNQKHSKVRAGKGKEAQQFKEQIKQEKADIHLNNILKMAHEQGAAMDEKIIKSNDNEILSRYPKLTKNKVQDIYNKVEKILSQDTFEKDDLYTLEQYEGLGSQTQTGIVDKGLLHQFYTPYIIVKKMYDLAFHYGFTTGNILEPSMGTGRFFKYAPEGAQCIGFDPDKKNVEIAKILYPNSIIHQEAFETAFLEQPRLNKMAKKSWLPEQDLVIGNPPYGDYIGYYKSYMPTVFKRFEFLFIYLGLKTLRQGGLLVFIVSQNFMNNGSMYKGMKEKILELGTFIDAIRLPNGIFSSTDVGTDIIIFKRK